MRKFTPWRRVALVNRREVMSRVSSCFVIVMFASAVVTVVTGTLLIRSGSGWVCMIPIIISPVMMVVVRLALDRSSPARGEAVARLPCG